MSARSRTRMTVFGVVIVIIAVASILEPPGVVEGVGYAVVVVVMVSLLLRERRRRR
ncbi:MAG TPA: hypothetical protein VGN08_06200 [Solirubrobacteraceae bacterium]